MAITAADVQKQYIAYFGRPADPAGLSYWTQIANQQGLQKTANFFGTTPEYQQRIGGLSIEQAVNTFYLNLFGRQADAAGLLFWTNKVQTGVLTLQDVGYFIATNASAADATTLGNKATSADRWTTSLDTTSEILAYNTASGQASGISFLSGVTTTAATEAQTTAAVATMTASSGGGTGGLSFNQISNGAVLTNTSNINGLGTAAGFTPSASVLGNANDLIRIGVFNQAVIQDAYAGTDNDTLLLDTANFAQSALVVAGVETITLNGASDFGVGTIGGVRTVNFLQAANFSAGASITTAVYSIGTTGVVAVGSGAGSLSAFDATLSANAGVLALGGTTAVNISNLGSGNSYTISQGAAGGGINFYAGSANTAYTLTLAGAGVYTAGGTFSGGGDFNLISLGNVAKFAGNPSAGNVFSFANATGLNTYTIQSNVGALGGINEVIAASSISGLDSIVRSTTGNGIGAGNNFGANFNLKSNTFSLGFFTASLTQNALGTGLSLLVGGNTIGLQAVNAGTAANETVNLTLNAGGTANRNGGGFSIQNGGLVILDNGIAGTATNASAAFNILSLNVVNNASALSLLNPISYTQNGGGAVITDTLTTFNLNATGVVSATFTQGALGYSSLMTFGFSQVDGGATFIYGSGLSAGSAVSLFLGSGNDIVTFLNSNVAAASAAGANASAIANSSYNFIDLSDGGNDTINIARGDTIVFGISAATLSRIASFGVGDVLSFTAQAGGVFAGGLQAVARGAAWAANTVNLYFDGTDTYVGVISANGGGASFANLGTLQGSAIITKLQGVDYSDVTRWSLVNSSMRLVA